MAAAGREQVHRGAPQHAGFVRDIESKRRHPGPFTNEIAQMMYGFGDVRAPLPESIAIVEDVVREFITKMARDASKLSAKRGKKLALEDVLLLVRKQPQMYYRARELNLKQKEIEQSRRHDKAIMQ